MHAVNPVIIAGLAEGVGRNNIRSGVGSQQKTFVKVTGSVILVMPTVTVVYDGAVELRIVLVRPGIATNNASDLGIDGCLAVAIPNSGHGVRTLPVAVPS
ncbi:MAG TPA: hypothetical protein EYP98_20910 [Planctomycetes bacterium]|nr:hypothetical protein [Planctomycetota bacterium]